MPTQANHFWQPSKARLLFLDAFLPAARGSASAAVVSQAWPAKDPGDILDYLLDVSAVLFGNEGDGIATLDVHIAPAGVGGLTLVSSAADGSCVVLWLSGGVAGRTYTVTVAITTENGRAIARDVMLPVLQLSTPSFGPALLAGTTPLMVQNLSTITVS